MSSEPEERQREVTRKDLAEELAQSRALNERLLKRLDEMEAKLAAPALTIETAILQRELDQANAELAQKRKLLEQASARQAVASADIALVPYEGLVIATAACCLDTRREAGEIFHVSLAALYTDDPFEAIVVTEWDAAQLPVKWEKNPLAPTPINFRFRKVISAAEDPTPRRANEF